MAPCERSELLMVSVQVFGVTSSEAASSSTLCRSRSWLWSVGPSGAQPRPATLSRQERAGLETFKIKPEAIISGMSSLARVECFMWIIERLSRCPAVRADYDESCLQMFMLLYRCVDQYLHFVRSILGCRRVYLFLCSDPVLASVTINCSLMRGCNGSSFAPLGLN